MNFRIKEAREKIGLSQKELAEALKIKPSTFNGYEKGIHDPKSEILKQIAIKCNTSVDFLLGLPETSDDSEGKFGSIDISVKRLLDNYNTLDEVGKNKLLEYSDDLVNTGSYLKPKQKEKHA